MPLFAFDLPFPAQVSPDLDQAREHNLAWLRGHGILRDQAWEQRYLAQQFVELAARAWPESRRADLDLVLGVSSWSAKDLSLADQGFVIRLTVRRSSVERRTARAGRSPRGSPGRPHRTHGSPLGSTTPWSGWGSRWPGGPAPGWQPSWASAREG
ncbi:hypothetical protein ACGFSI_10210 [Streptomyces virginiae]|uniref:hypothetical protein n=1 Tax=Streptomyces virginiae TaxID=1961 RepID=UPI00371BEC43